MKKNYFLFLFTMLSTFGFSQVGTNFEEPIGGNTNYIDANITSHTLSNNGGGQPTVVHTSTGGELGFSTRFVTTRPGAAGSTAMSDGDAIGVLSNAMVISSSDVTSWNSGNAFSIEDPDGLLIVEFDEVDLSGTTTPRLQLDYFIDGTSYEITDGVNDRLFIGIQINGGSVVSIVDTDGGGQGGGVGNDLNGAFTEDAVVPVDFDLAPYIGSRVRLIIEGDNNASTEHFLIDNILFTQGTNLTLSVDNNELRSKISLYPNPIQKDRILNISNNSQNTITSVEVYDVVGKKVLSEVVTTESIQFPNTFPSGMYFVKITDTKNNSVTKKVMLQ
jgi:hypothetical protein